MKESKKDNHVEQKHLQLRFYGILSGLYLFMFILNYKTYYELGDENKERNNNNERSKHATVRNNNKRNQKPWDLKIAPPEREWIQEYVSWHTEQRKNRFNDPQSNKYLIVVSDRVIDTLQSLPYYLLAAYKTRRILLIKWRNLDLEEYLMPPIGGLNWRLPKNMDVDSKLDVWTMSCARLKIKRACLHLWERTNENILNKKKLVISGRDDMYDELKDEYFVTKEGNPFIEIFDIFFSPTPILWDEVLKTMRGLSLNNKKYIAAHFSEDDFTSTSSRGQSQRIRTLPNDLKKQIMHNSINCVVHKFGGDEEVPVYFSSNNIDNVEYVLKESPYSVSKKHSSAAVKVLGIIEGKKYNQNINKDKELMMPTRKTRINDKNTKNILVDIWLLRMSECVSYGLGRYGILGARLNGGNCTIEYHRSFLRSCPSALHNT